MKNILQKIISFFLIISLFIGSSFTALANNNYDNPNNEKYIVLDIVETKSGPMYYISPKNSSRSLWDVTDILMAGWSWSDFFGEPSFKNFGWAVLDTASILPLLPSSAYVRKGGKVFLKQDEIKKFAKTKKGKEVIKKNLKETKVKVSENAVKKLDFIFGLATGNKHNIDRSKEMLSILKSIGIYDSPTWRRKILEQINIQLNNPFSIKKFIKKDGKLITVRDLLLVGPGGFAKMETHWISGTTTMTTVFIFKNK